MDVIQITRLSKILRRIFFLRYSFSASVIVGKETCRAKITSAFDISDKGCSSHNFKDQGSILIEGEGMIRVRMIQFYVMTSS